MSTDSVTLMEPAPVSGRAAPALKGARLMMVAPSTSTHTHRWARYFAQEQGMVVQVISPFDDPIENIPVIKFPPERTWYHGLRRIHLYVDYMLRWKAYFRDFSPDLVHVHYPDGGFRNHFYYNSVQRLVTSTWGSDVCETPQFPLPQRHKEGVRALLARSNVITATTRFLARVTTRYCPPGTPIHIVPFGVDCERFRPAPAGRAQEGGLFRIGFTKNLEPKYGPEVLIAAMPQIVRRHPQVRLIMCGRGDMKQELESQVQRLGMGPYVSFPGRIAHDHIVPLMQSLDLMAMPSTCQESFGVAAIEASACQVPVVATSVGGVPEAVVDGQTGLLVPPFDPDALARACIELIEDPERRRLMGIAGRQFVLENYPWQANAATMASIYEQLLAGGHVMTPHMIRA